MEQENREINFDDEDEAEVDENLAQLDRINQNFLNYNQHYVSKTSSSNQGYKSNINHQSHPSHS